jgi:hypothetical protein
MKRMLVLLFLGLLLIQACSKEKPGEIAITLDFDASVNQAIQDSIEQFVFVIGEVGSTQKLLYPSDCLGCASDQFPCPESDQCLKSTSCGFSASDSVFDPQVDFENVQEGENMEVTACALDIDSVPVAAGQGQVENTAGNEETILMFSTVTDCINNLPASICD